MRLWHRIDGGYVLTFTEHSANVRHAMFSLNRYAAELGSDQRDVCTRRLWDFVKEICECAFVYVRFLQWPSYVCWMMHSGEWGRLNAVVYSVELTLCFVYQHIQGPCCCVT